MNKKIEAIRQQIDKLSDEEWDELKGKLFILPPPRKPKPPKGLNEQMEDTIKLADRALTRFERHEKDPAFDKLELRPHTLLSLTLLAQALNELVKRLEVPA